MVPLTETVSDIHWWWTLQQNVLEGHVPPAELQIHQGDYADPQLMAAWMVTFNQLRQLGKVVELTAGSDYETVLGVGDGQHMPRLLLDPALEQPGLQPGIQRGRPYVFWRVVDPSLDGPKNAEIIRNWGAFQADRSEVFRVNPELDINPRYVTGGILAQPPTGKK